ncbi:hypothetical protein, partial [uncultured Thiodictyon sp.]|uniref:hypothetical protein n=1 Tax=uncultured Thiodictyon sp. TaxID=1846217 RepID=UPI002600DBC4
MDEPVGRKALIASDCRRLAQALARQGRGAEGRWHAERAVALYTDLRSPDLAEAQATLAECRAQPPWERLQPRRDLARRRGVVAAEAAPRHAFHHPLRQDRRLRQPVA